MVGLLFFCFLKKGLGYFSHTLGIFKLNKNPFSEYFRDILPTHTFLLVYKPEDPKNSHNNPLIIKSDKGFFQQPNINLVPVWGGAFQG